MYKSLNCVWLLLTGNINCPTRFLDSNAFLTVQPRKPTLKITKEKLIEDAWQATLSCERTLGQPATSLRWRVLFNTGVIRENIFSAQSNITTQEGCSSSVISEVTQRFTRPWDGAEICCYLTDAGGMTLNMESCAVFTFKTGAYKRAL